MTWLVLCWPAVAWLAFAQSGIPVAATIKPGPRNSGSAWVTIRNASKSPLTALILTFSHQRYSVIGGVVRVHPEGSPDTASPGTLFRFDSALRNGSEIKPGGTFRIRSTALDPSGQIQVAAAILADGQTFGDPAHVQAILAQRRAVLRALPIVIRHFPKTPPPPGPASVCEVPPGPPVPVAHPAPGGEEVVYEPGPGALGLPPDLSACRTIQHPKQGAPNFMPVYAAALPEELAGIKDPAAVNAVLAANSAIMQGANAVIPRSDLHGYSPKKVMAKLLAMLHAWQDGLSNSLPSLAAAP